MDNMVHENERFTSTYVSYHSSNICKLSIGDNREGFASSRLVLTIFYSTHRGILCRGNQASHISVEQ